MDEGHQVVVGDVARHSMMTTTVAMGIAAQSRQRDNKQHFRGYLANIEVSKRVVIDIYGECDKEISPEDGHEEQG